MSPSHPTEDIVAAAQSIRSSLITSLSSIRTKLDEFEGSNDPQVLDGIESLLSEETLTLADVWKFKFNLEGESEAQLCEKIASDFLAYTREEGILKSHLLQLGEDYKPAHDSFFRNVLALHSMKQELAAFGGSKKLKSEIAEYANLFLEIFSRWEEGGAQQDILDLRNKISIKVLALNKVSPANSFHSKSNERALKCELAYEMISKLQKRLIEQGKTYLDSASRLAESLDKLDGLVHKNTEKLTASNTEQSPAQLSAVGSDAAIPNPQGNPADVGSSENDLANAKPPDNHSTGQLERIDSNTEAPAPVKAEPDDNFQLDAIDNPKLEPENIRSTARAKTASRNRIRDERSLIRKLALPAALLITCLAIYFGLKSPWGQNLTNTESDKPIHFAGHSHVKPGADDEISSIADHLSSLTSLTTSLDSTADSSTQGNASALTALKNPEYGIDVSHYQGDIDWKTVAAFDTLGKAITFAIVKSSEGVSSDPKFIDNWTSAKGAIPKVGAYHYFSFKTDGKKQAEHFIKTVDLKKGDIRPIVDVESSCTKCFEDGDLSHQEFIANLTAYISAIEKHYDTRVIIYAAEYWYRKYLKGSFPEHDFWLANYSKSKSVEQIAKSHTNPNNSERAIMWQFSPTGSLNGIEGAVDLNYLPSQYSSDILIQ